MDGTSYKNKIRKQCEIDEKEKYHNDIKYDYNYQWLLYYEEK